MTSRTLARVCRAFGDGGTLFEKTLTSIVVKGLEDFPFSTSIWAVSLLLVKSIITFLGICILML